MAIYHKCSKCGKQKLQETRSTPQGISFNALEFNGWTRNKDKLLLCEKCSPKKKG